MFIKVYKKKFKDTPGRLRGRGGDGGEGGVRMQLVGGKKEGEKEDEVSKERGKIKEGRRGIRGK